MTTPEYRINRQIRAREVRLIIEEADGKSRNMGVLPLARALEIAEDMELDLVEVSPESNPPVCKIQDFGKFQYEKQRRERKARKQQKNIEVKEIQLGPKTDDHHLTFKVRDARRWIEEGMKVKVRVKFKGREITHPEIGRTRLEKIAIELQDISVVEQKPSLEGRSMLMVLAPLPEKK
ncbi:MAG: translation initiation factor IF-3 [bacterium]|nr:translation initiation factor IF-3 [bacterium]